MGLLRNEERHVNNKRAYRLYREEGLIARKKVLHRRVACVKREIRAAAASRNECWSMGFVSDQSVDNHRLRVPAIVQDYTPEFLAIEASSKIHGVDVVTTLERSTSAHGLPKRINVGNGPEFISKDLSRWASWNHSEIDFSRPGRPSDDALVEAFNSRFRQE